MSNIALVAITLLIVLAIYRFLPGFLSRVAILAGLVPGMLVAAAFGKVDFSRIGQSQWFAVSTPFHFGAPQFDAAAIASVSGIILVALGLVCRSRPRGRRRGHPGARRARGRPATGDHGR